MTAALLHDEIPAREPQSTPEPSEERDDFMQRAANRGRDLSKFGVGGLVGSLVIVGATVGLGQEAQRQSVTDTTANRVAEGEDALKSYNDAVRAAMNGHYSKEDVIGPAFDLKNQNDIYGNATGILTSSGINSVEVNLDGIIASSNILAQEVPQPTDKFGVVKTDVNGDGKTDIIVVDDSQINREG